MAHLEIETKLAVPDDAALPGLRTVKGVAAEAERAQLLDAVYWDTADLALARQGVTVRRRTGEDPVRWTLKLPAADGDGRWEVEVASRGARVPAALVELLTPWLLGAPLRVAVELRTARTSRVLLDDRGERLCEVVDDRVAAVGGTGLSWREVEVEVLGSRAVAERVVTHLVASGATRAGTASKAQLALGVLEERPPDVGPRDPAGLLVHRVLGVGLRGLRVHDGGVRTDRTDAVHQLRVSCRRLRSDLRALRPLLDDDRAAPLRDELRWLAGELGAARDLEVLRERLRRTAADDLDIAGVDALLEQDEAAALGRARSALASPRYLALLSALSALAADVAVTPLAARDARDVLPRLRERAERRLEQDLARLTADGPDESWHDARKSAKQARYVAETVAGVLGGHRHAKRAKRLQQLLGEHADAVVAAERLEALALQAPALALVCGRLVERERAAARRVRSLLLG